MNVAKHYQFHILRDYDHESYERLFRRLRYEKLFALADDKYLQTTILNSDFDWYRAKNEKKERD